MMHFYRHNSDTPEKIDLQRIVIEEPPLDGVKNLYIRQKEKDNSTVFYSTDTYINIFHYTYLKKITTIKQVWLDVCCSGQGILHLNGHQIVAHSNHSCSIQSSILSSIHIRNKESRETFRIDLDDGYDFFSLSWEHSKKESFHIWEASYSTIIPSSYRPVRLAIVTTTYKRPQDVRALAATYTAACSRFFHLQEETHLFIINNDVTDTDIQLLQCKNITVINNPHNLGGAGGFACGARFAVNTETFSHVLFMDDDALVHEESWLRSLSILSCLKEEFYDCPIAGSMFNRKAPSYCQTMIEALDKNFHRYLICGESLLEATTAVCTFLDTGYRIVSTISDATLPKTSYAYPYAAWWYGIFSVAIFQKYGYPAPYFFRGDDQEFGIRIGKHPIFLNGICIWHPPFEQKKNALRQYLGMRNFLLTVARHHKFWKRIMLQEIFTKMTRCMAGKDYSQAAAILLAIKDALNFQQVPLEGEKLIPRLYDEITRFQNITFPISKKFISASQSFRKTRWSSLALWLTLGGALVPSILRYPFAICSFQQASACWRAQNVAYPGDNTGRMFQASTAIKIWKEALFSLLKILFTHKKNFAYLR